MEEFKGTKGSWFIEKKLDHKHEQYVYAIGSKYNDEVLNEEFITAWTWMIEEEAEANAQLIAAAPNLLEALQELIKWSAHIPDLANQDLEKAQKAIKKALGK